MKKYISELLGTFVLVLVGCGVAVATGANVVATSLAFGLTIVAMAYTIGSISGCHVNPAVSLIMYLNDRLSLKDFVGYVIAQVLGAIAASALLGYFFESFKTLGANGFDNGMLATTALMAIIIEVILTFIFTLVIVTITAKKEHATISGLVIGLTLTLVHLLGIPFTGTSVNPARSLAPAIFQGGDALAQVWVFILAPLLGAVLASIFYKLVIKEK